MFTGLIEEIGQVKDIQRIKKSFSVTINTKKITSDMQIGDSISTNGLCLTVTHFTKNSFTADVMPESIARSNFKYLTIGDKINLERAIQPTTRLGGHIINGHIDGIGSIVRIEKDENAILLTIQTTKNILYYVVEKGSIAIDGVSLTIVDHSENSFRVSIIPQTQIKTTLIQKKLTETVNIECDILAKYVEKLCSKRKENKIKPKSKIDWKFLHENGFV